MFEWRIFKQLQIANLADFEEYIHKQKKKQNVEKHTDLYFFLPPQFSNLNRQLGLKLRDVKFSTSGWNVKIKGKKIEIKELKQTSEQNFEYWEKTIKREMKKKFKLPICSLQQISQLRELDVDSSIVEIVRKQSMKSKLKKSKQEKEEENIYQSQGTSKEEKQTQSNTSQLNQTNPPPPLKFDLQLNKDHVYVADSNDISKGLKEVVSEIIHKIEKYKIQSNLINCYLECFNKCLTDNTVSLCIIEKFVYKGNNYDESIIRIKRLKQSYDSQQQHDFHQYYVTCSALLNDKSQQLDEKLYQSWVQKYDLPQLNSLKQGKNMDNIFIGGYPEFNSTFA